ncbi:hypothetical protein [Glutamicibacter arilaitensis]|nr:hypothetical protein [Glutamicibacter arilaitensis]
MGPAGPIGPEGPQGQQGEQGETGGAGAAGAKGETGDRGEAGEQGVQGAEGIPGAPPIQFGFVEFIDGLDAEGYIGVAGSRVVAAVSDAEVLAPRDTALSGLSLTAGSFSGNVTLTLLKDGTATALKCTITEADPECVIENELITVESGSELVFQYASSSPKPVKNLRFALGFENTP